LARFLFEDDAGVRPLHEVDDPRLLDEIGSVRSFVEKTLTESSYDEVVSRGWWKLAEAA
jgi:hypothetical protein